MANIPEFGELKALRRMADQGPERVGLERPVTIRRLFTQTSGLCYPNPTGSPAEKLLAQAMGNPHDVDVAGEPSLEEWASRLVKAPLAHQPGAGWTYGFSIDVLGRLI